MKKLSLLAIPTLLFTALVGFSPSSAAPVCTEGECVETFEYSGEAVVWQVPANASNLRFDAYGAQGGRSGGFGGRVTGSFGELPNQLYLFVGGRGEQGTSHPGGFNGGGAAGGNNADEGSGGGASDIRVGPNLEHRIVVAGGGGGTGGRKGGPGGAGGGLLGQSGVSGQGGGGGGGSQTSGGAAGTANGGTRGTAGSFGIGGNGGFSQTSGGGGGGGGWYGGGGGGPDVESCCQDGGGGGGGSSYSYAQATNVSHHQGARSGHGLIIIRYQLPAPTVAEFSASQIRSGAVFTLQFSGEVTGLSVEDFTLLSGDCGLVEVSGQLADYQVLVQECKDPLLTLQLSAYSVGAPALGPAEPAVAALTLDLEPPELAWRHEPISLSASPIFILEYADAEQLAAESDFAIEGCTGFLLEYEEATVAVIGQDCRDGEVSLRLEAHSFSDAHGNSAPFEPLLTTRLVDLSDPEVSWLAGEVTFSAEGAAVQVAAVFSEPIAHDVEPSMLVGGDAVCEWSSQLNESQLLLNFFNCSVGTLELSWPAQSLTDAAGRIGPVTSADIQILIIDPVEPDEPVELPELVEPEPTDPSEPVVPEDSIEPIEPTEPEVTLPVLPDGDLPTSDPNLSPPPSVTEDETHSAPGAAPDSAEPLASEPTNSGQPARAPEPAVEPTTAPTTSPTTGDTLGELQNSSFLPAHVLIANALLPWHNQGGGVAQAKPGASDISLVESDEHQIDFVFKEEAETPVFASSDGGTQSLTTPVLLGSGALAILAFVGSGLLLYRRRAG